jgi:hypothetical protein
MYWTLYVLFFGELKEEEKNRALRGLNNSAHRARHPGAGTPRIVYRGVLISCSSERAQPGGSVESGATQRAALQGLLACCSDAVDC